MDPARSGKGGGGGGGMVLIDPWSQFGVQPLTTFMIIWSHAQQCSVLCVKDVNSQNVDLGKHF
jgi:hypothetical protein